MNTAPHFVLTQNPACSSPFSPFNVNIRSGLFIIRRRQLQNEVSNPDGALTVRQGGTA